ncbi:MAG: ABC transporter ATP-binding protein/permease [Bacilli bacterium]|nr:ABC transporter ATP-binding protein/permease [Bacilli bacterium]
MRLKGDHKIPTKQLVNHLYHFIKPELLRFALAMLLIIANVALDIVTPLIITKHTETLTALTTTSGQEVLLAIISFGVGFFALSLANQVLRYIETMLLQRTGQKIIYNLRMKVFTHIENMSQNQFTEMPVGSLVTRVASYTASMSELFTTTLVQMLRNILTVVGVLGIMIFLSPILTGFLSIIIVVLFVVSMIFNRYISKAFTKERGCLSDLNTFLSENLGGMKITQIFNQEKRKEAQFNEKNNAYFRSRIKLMLGFGIYRPFVSFLYFGAIALTFFVGLQINLTSGMIVGFYLYLSRFFNPIQNLADQLNSLQKAKTASERLFNLLDVKPQVLDKPTARDIEHFEGKIEFRNVWFAYNKEEWILKNVSFVIDPKTTVAFVGPTGSGKTTILSLIVRNYEIQKGQILIDDIDIQDITITSLRRAIGQMLQDVFLFSGNIRTNISLHDESFSDDEINEACEYVNADKFINKLPNKLDEQVIERGENFSQGQRQLLSFARTVLHKPQILILDEATANIDTETEVLIQESLEKMKSIGTMLVVAHRLSTIQKCDQIFVLLDGEIIEKGTHQELLKHRNFYYKLYQLQFEE